MLYVIKNRCLIFKGVYKPQIKTSLALEVPGWLSC